MFRFCRSSASWLSLLAIMAMILPMGCSDDESTSPEVTEAPEIPPTTTMLIDFSNFTSEPFVASPGNGMLEPMTNQHWGWAALNVVWWQTAITVWLAIPVATFVESFNHEPELQEDGTWVWSYSVTVGSNVYTAALHGRFGGLGTQWEMYISKAGEYTDFLWYRGEADILLTEGWWLMYESPDVPVELLDIDWHRYLETQTGDIRYTNVKPGHADNGGYISYGTTTGTTYDAFYDIYNIGEDNHTDVEWHRMNQNGRVRDPDHFGDNEWYCWDENLEDTECP
jgi:hypothetical protein